MSKQLIELLLVEIDLLRKTLLQYVTPNTNFMQSWDNHGSLIGF
jgi:hypothetical protein